MTKIAIHGFGRIGRTALRIALETESFVPVAISDIKDPGTLAALFEVDTNYGRWREEVRADGAALSSAAVASRTSMHPQRYRTGVRSPST